METIAAANMRIAVVSFTDRLVRRGVDSGEATRTIQRLFPIVRSHIRAHRPGCFNDSARPALPRAMNTVGGFDCNFIPGGESIQSQGQSGRRTMNMVT